MRKRILACVVLMLFVSLLGSGCGRKVSHCYLHEGFAYDAPCIVDLSNGNITDVSVIGDKGYMQITTHEGVSVMQLPEDQTSISLSGEDQSVNTALFCDDCLALIEAVPNHGYVLADLRDLGDIRLYPIAEGTSELLGHQILVEREESGNIRIVAERYGS